MKHTTLDNNFNEELLIAFLTLYLGYSETFDISEYEFLSRIYQGLNAKQPPSWFLNLVPRSPPDVLTVQHQSTMEDLGGQKKSNTFEEFQISTRLRRFAENAVSHLLTYL